MEPVLRQTEPLPPAPSLRTRLFIAYGAVLLTALAAIAVAIFSTVDIAQVATNEVQQNRVMLDEALELAASGRMDSAKRAIATLETSTLDAQSRAAKVAVLLGSAIAMILLVGVWVSVRIARDITQPIDRMVAAAARFGKGEFRDRVPTGEVRELDALAERFNQMAQRLERLRANDFERVMKEQRRIESVLESIDDGLLILDGEGRVQRANGVALRQIGAKQASDVLGRTASEVLPFESLFDAIGQSLTSESRETYGGEITLGPAQAKRRLDYSLMPFHDGSHPGLVLVLRDVTEQRAFEELRTQFVLRASHELRTPVTGVRMAYDLLAKRLKFDPETREAELVDTIKQELDRLGKLLNDLLDLSRLYAQSAEIESEEVPAEALVSSAAKRFASQLEQAGITLDVDAAQCDAVVRVDRDRIDRVFDNLIDNAQRHTPRGGRIVLSAARHGPEVEFVVRDTGDGIPGAIQNRIFEPFSQYGDNNGGTGLGLALCKEILAHHHGRMELDSDAGQGARFSFRLPLAV